MGTKCPSGFVGAGIIAASVSSAVHSFFSMSTFPYAGQIEYFNDNHLMIKDLNHVI